MGSLHKNNTEAAQAPHTVRGSAEVVEHRATTTLQTLQRSMRLTQRWEAPQNATYRYFQGHFGVILCCHFMRFAAKQWHRLLLL